MAVKRRILDLLVFMVIITAGSVIVLDKAQAACKEKKCKMIDKIGFRTLVGGTWVYTCSHTLLTDCRVCWDHWCDENGMEENKECTDIVLVTVLKRPCDPCTLLCTANTNDLQEASCTPVGNLSTYDFSRFKCRLPTS